MGFLSESIATAARAKRCKPSWQPHYDACKQVMVEAVSKATQRRTALIFGAGSLRDVPLQALSRAFERVLLVDLLFLPAARRLAAPYANVQLIEHDVTESLGDLYRGQFSVNAPIRWLDRESIDLVVSLNLMTQLPLMPMQWFTSPRPHPAISETLAERLGLELMEKHIAYLRGFQKRQGVPVCLIADRKVQRKDVGDRLVSEWDPWWGIDPIACERSWAWLVAPVGEISSDYAQWHQVGVSYL
jgi:hypothetical protein